MKQEIIMKKQKDKKGKMDLNEITVIKLTKRTREKLKEFKYNERESYESIINKMIDKIKDKEDILLFQIGKAKKEKLI